MYNNQLRPWDGESDNYILHPHPNIFQEPRTHAKEAHHLLESRKKLKRPNTSYHNRQTCKQAIRKRPQTGIRNHRSVQRSSVISIEEARKEHIAFESVSLPISKKVISIEIKKLKKVVRNASSVFTGHCNFGKCKFNSNQGIVIPMKSILFSSSKKERNRKSTPNKQIFINNKLIAAMSRNENSENKKNIQNKSSNKQFRTGFVYYNQAILQSLQLRSA